jgi:transposase
MIGEEKRKFIWGLHQIGMSNSEISKRTEVDRKTVRSIIRDKGCMPEIKKSRDTIDEELLRDTFEKCEGRVQRVHEIFEEQGLNIGYSTLTRKVSELGLRNNKKKRAEQRPDIPGEEFQHDTSPYVLEIGGKRMRVQASQLYYRYSKRRYLKFYPSFKRFHMKSFFHEALTHLQYSCKQCVIDNTNLAVKSGSGKNAILNPEMVAFAKLYGFDWLPHEIKHSDRKAGVERTFWTVETNFFTGRSFTSFDDLNRQAFDWCEAHAKRPNKKTKIIPAEVFEQEKQEMNQIPPHVPAPYIIHSRKVDQYGYVNFETNNYWVPRGTTRDVIVLEYASAIHIYQGRKLVQEYDRPSFEVREKNLFPPGVKINHLPKKKASPTDTEELKLKGLGEDVAFYLKSLLKGTSSNRRYQAVRQLYSIHRQLSPDLFLETVKRSIKYRLFDIKRFEATALEILKNDGLQMPLIDSPVGLEEKENYKEGQFTDAPSLEFYDQRYGGSSGQKD